MRRHIEGLSGFVHGEGNSYEQGVLGEWNVVLRLAGVGNQTAAVETERAISEFSPNVVLFVGVAGGIKDVQLGDVVVGERVRCYDSGKDDGGFKHRDAGSQASFRLLEAAKSVKVEGDWALHIPPKWKAGDTPNVEIGVIAVGDKVVASSSSVSFTDITSRASDAIAVEMESGGFLTAANASSGVEAIIVRGISDLIDAKKESDELGWQSRASANAAAFAVEILHEYARRNSRQSKHSIAARRRRHARLIRNAPTGVEPSESPYIGPRPYPSEFWNFFHGREDEKQRLTQCVLDSRCVLLYGASGAGKSSLINSTLGRDLRVEGWDVLMPARVGFAVREAANADREANIFSVAAAVSLFGANAAQRVGTLREHLCRTKNAESHRLLVLDQFEEIFTRHRSCYDQRSAFVDEMGELLEKDSGLHLVFSLRQDYLADAEELLRPLFHEFEVSRFPLQRMAFDQAVQAVSLPARQAAEYAPGLVADIVRRANSIRLTHPDGHAVSKPAEHIDLVQLQIIFDGIWQRLEKGLTVIREEDVLAATGKPTLDAVVDNALTDYLNKVISEVSRSPLTLKNGGMSEDLIRLGCMGFTTQNATREVRKSVAGRVGRLPDWIVQQLDDMHLLTSEKRGGQVWYELAHDRLAAPVSRELSPEVARLHSASEVIGGVIENIKADNGPKGLSGHFGDYDSLIRDCEAFATQQSLFSDEAEFVLRAALTSGTDRQKWVKRVSNDYSNVFSVVLSEALEHRDEVVRKNATLAAGDTEDDENMRQIAEIALSDDSTVVREAATATLARVGSRAGIAHLFQSLEIDQANSQAKSAIAAVRSLHFEVCRVPALTALLRSLPLTLQADLALRSWAARATKAVVALPLIVGLAAIFALLAAASTKWIFGAFNLAICQGTASAGMGAFHGAIAGVVWEGTIVAFIATYYAVFADELAKKSFLRPLPAIWFGMIGGLISSVLITVIVASVYRPQSLYAMSWTHTETAVSAESLFVSQRYAWQYLLTGTALGVGVALCMNRVRSLPRWQELTENRDGLVKPTQLGVLLAIVGRIVVPQSWLIAMPIVVAWCFAIFVPSTVADGFSFSALVSPETDIVRTQTSTFIGNALRLLADGVIQWLGGVVGLVGAGAGGCIAARGFQFNPSAYYALKWNRGDAASESTGVVE